MTYPKLETERLLLRGFLLSDAPRVQALAGDQEIARVTLNIPHPYADGLAESWISSHPKDFELGRSAVFAITERVTHELLGAVGLTINRHHARAELGYWIGRPFWGKGYASEAATRLLEYGFTELRLNRIHAAHFSENPASGRVMQKIGMEPEGLLKEHYLKWDHFVDSVIYGIQASAWHGKKDPSSP